MDMSIAALSVNMHMAQSQQDFGVAVIMEADTSMLEEALESVESLDPDLGNVIDVSV